MATYKELKSVAYINQIISYAEELLGLTFRPSGANKYSAYCPFHTDKESSFRVYVNADNEVRFHCFGACNSEWDIYDLIMKRRGHIFRRAQNLFAEYVGDAFFKAYRSDFVAPDNEKAELPVSTIAFAVPSAEMRPEIIEALTYASEFYHQQLIENQDKYSLVIKYLGSRGVSLDAISRFRIGFCPAFKDEAYEGRALILNHLETFHEDYLTFNNYAQAGLIRHLNIEGSPYQRFTDPRKSWGIFGGYADYFAGRITFPVYDIDGRVCGFVGRRIDNRGKARWIKQQTDRTVIRPKGWLYGIDKAAEHIARQKTVIIVEGIFDYFAFYNISTFGVTG